MANTSVSGLVSGLDTATIISQLMQLEAQPQTNLKNRVSLFQKQVSSLQTVNSKLQSIAGKAADLAKLSAWTPVKATSDNDKVTVSASSTATPASLAFKVVTTASGATATFRQTSALSSVVAANTTLTLHFDDSTKSDLTVSTGDGKLQTIADALNATGQVKATLVKAGVDATGAPTYKLSVANLATGSSSGFSIGAVSGGLLGGVQTSASVQDIAQTATSSTAPATASSGTYRITSGAATYDFSIAGGSNLDQVAAVINDPTNATGVTASVVAAGAGYRVELTGTNGASFALDPTGATTDSLLGGPMHSVGGADASIDVNGQSLTSTMNTFTGLMPGVNVTVATGSEGALVNIAVSRDAQSLSDKVKGMVDAVNATLDDIDSLTAYKTDTSAAGILAGDATLRDVRNQLLSSVTNGIDGQSLASVGIQTDKTGHLVFDAGKFTSAYNADPTGTAAKFAGTATYSGTGTVILNGSTWRTREGTYAVDAGGTIGGQAATISGSILTGASGSAVDGLSLNVSSGSSGTVTYRQGIAAKLEALAQRASDSTVGSVTGTINGRNDSIKGLNDDIAGWDVMLAAKQQSLQRQYAALEVALGKLQDQASWLNGQIASLPKMG